MGCNNQFMSPSFWPSLVPDLDVENHLFGASSTLLSNWLERQFQLIDDPNFARLFSDNIDCFDVEPSAYNHRLIETKNGALLGGIRFYGLDIMRPFVEVVAHSFSQMDGLCGVVRDEWAVFSPQFLRLTVAANTMTTPEAFLDVSIHAERYGEMKRRNLEINLTQDVKMREVEALIVERYGEVQRTQPDLAKNISAMDMETLKTCHEQGNLFGAHIDASKHLVGVIAVKEDAIGWLPGEVVQEEVVAAVHAGHGYAMQMQCAFANQRAAATPDRLMLGTIDRHNHASRRSAVRAGRPEILRRVFVPL